LPVAKETTKSDYSAAYALYGLYAGPAV